MAKRRDMNVIGVALLDILSGALGAVIILFIAVPKAKISKDKFLQAQVKLEKKVKPVVDVKKLQKELKRMSLQLQLMKSIENKLETKNKSLEETIANQTTNQATKEINEIISEQAKETNLTTKKRDVASMKSDVGFKFKGKHILFIIDTSGSMLQDDKIGQVKAGLKMLITTMGVNFNIDVIQYPARYQPFRTLWSRFGSMTLENKQKVYDFLQDMKPYGPTPTRDVLKYALSNINYKNKISDIVLLSDGAPTFYKKIGYDDIYSILRQVKKSNGTKVRINTVGVGRAFLYGSNSNQYKFLKYLAEDNGGFFVGF